MRDTNRLELFPNPDDEAILFELGTLESKLDFGRVKIVFLDSVGRPWTPSSGEQLLSHQFVVYVDGVLQTNIASIKIPELSYYGPIAPLTVTIKYYIV